MSTHRAAIVTNPPAPSQSLRFPGRGRVTAVLTNGRGQVVLAALLYLGYAVFLTWPLVARMHSSVFGAGGNDLDSLLAVIRELSTHGHTPFTPGTLHAFSAPEGLRIDWAGNITSWPSLAVLWLLTVPFGSVFAVDMFVFMGYVLNGLSMFLLARRITRSPAAALVAGFAFAFFPFVIVNGQLHQPFMHVWVFVLMAWRLLVVSERPTVRNGVWAGLATVIAVSWTAYFILLGGVLFAAFMACDLLLALVRDRTRLWPLVRAYSAAGVIVLAVVIGYRLLAAAGGSGVLSVHEPIAELYTYAARPLEYLLPDAHNLIFGNLTARYLFTHAHGSGYGEINLYLGVIPLLLVAIGAIALVRGRLAPELRRPWLLFGFTVLAATWVSAPPTWQVGPFTIYFPGYLIFQYVNGFRAYSRLVGVVMMGVVICAAIGLGHVLRGRPRVTQLIIALVLLPLVALDLWARPDPTVSALPHPAVYKILRHEPPGIVAEYPLTAAAVPSYEPLLDQPQHGHPILNGYAEFSDEEARALELTRLDDPNTASRLALLGVRYVVVNEGPPPEYTAAPGTPGRGFTLVASIGGRALYDVVARPASSWVSVGAGFSMPEGHDGSAHWLTASTSSLEVRATCARCNGIVQFGTSSYLHPRILRIRDPSGRLLYSHWIPTTSFSVSFPVRFARAERVSIAISPDPQSAAGTSGGADTRTLGLIFTDLRFVPSAITR